MSDDLQRRAEGDPPPTHAHAGGNMVTLKPMGTGNIDGLLIEWWECPYAGCRRYLEKYAIVAAEEPTLW